MTTKQNLGIWSLRLIAAIILLQTLFFKFSAAPVSIYIFNELGIEPWGRIVTGILELVASILLIIPRTTVYGAILALGTMVGAIFFHLTKLGIVVQNDSGKLFILALVVAICCLFLIVIHRRQLISLLNRNLL